VKSYRSFWQRVSSSQLVKGFQQNLLSEMHTRHSSTSLVSVHIVQYNLTWHSPVIVMVQFFTFLDFILSGCLSMCSVFVMEGEQLQSSQALIPLGRLCVLSIASLFTSMKTHPRDSPSAYPHHNLWKIRLILHDSIREKIQHLDASKQGKRDPLSEHRCRGGGDCAAAVWTAPFAPGYYTIRRRAPA
jgi:hypothetical protein